VKRNFCVYFAAISATLFFLNTAYAKNVDRIVAKVNDDIVLQSELNENVSSFVSQAQLSVASSEMKKKILDQMIDEKILLQEAKKENIEISDDEIKTAFQNLRDKFPTKEDFNRELRKQNLTILEVQANLVKQLKIMRLIEKNVKRKIQVSSKEIDEYASGRTNQSKDEIKNLIFDQKFNDAFTVWMKKLKEDAIIEIKL